MERLLKILIAVGLILILEIGLMIFILQCKVQEQKTIDIPIQSQNIKRYELCSRLYS